MYEIFFITGLILSNLIMIWFDRVFSMFLVIWIHSSGYIHGFIIYIILEKSGPYFLKYLFSILLNSFGNSSITYLRLPAAVLQLTHALLLLCLFCFCFTLGVDIAVCPFTGPSFCNVTFAMNPFQCIFHYRNFSFCLQKSHLRL